MERFSVLLQPVYMLLCNFSWGGGSQSVFKDIMTVCRTICWADEGDEHFSSKKQWMMIKNLDFNIIWYDFIFVQRKKKNDPFIRRHTFGTASELLKLLTFYSCWSAKLTLHSLRSTHFDKSAKFLLQFFFTKEIFFLKNLYTDCERALENH